MRRALAALLRALSRLVDPAPREIVFDSEWEEAAEAYFPNARMSHTAGPNVTVRYE